LWDTYIRTDAELLTKAKLTNNSKNLNYFDAVWFYTTGDLGLTDQQKADLLSFVRDDGKGFLGAHSATTLITTGPIRRFDRRLLQRASLDAGALHYSHRGQDLPGHRAFPDKFPFYDEIYQFKAPYSREKVRVLMSVDPDSVDSPTRSAPHRQGFRRHLVHNYGKGRVFYSSLGHRDEVWDMPDIQKMWIEAVKWTLGLTAGDATPRPQGGH